MRHLMLRLNRITMVVAMVVTFTSLSAENTDRPAVSVYNVSSRRSLKPVGPQLIMALWADGQIIWSATNSGPPYQKGQFPPERLRALLQRLEQKGTFKDMTFSRAWYGPDSSYTTIAIEDGPRRLRMRSWHELFEQNTNLVASATGVETLAGRSRDQVLQKQPADYRAFRNTWTEIRQALTALIPPKGELYEGPLPAP